MRDQKGRGRPLSSFCKCAKPPDAAPGLRRCLIPVAGQAKANAPSRRKPPHCSTSTPSALAQRHCAKINPSLQTCHTWSGAPRSNWNPTSCADSHAERPPDDTTDLLQSACEAVPPLAAMPRLQSLNWGQIKAIHTQSIKQRDPFHAHET